MGAFGKAGVIGVAAAGVVALGSKLSDVAKESLQVKAVFNNLKFGIEGAAEASLGMVDNMTLAQAQVRAVELGAITTKEEFEKLAHAGSVLGMVMEGDAAAGVDKLTVAIARGSALRLDDLGIVLSKSAAEREHARDLGKTVSQLTAAEKAESFRVIALKKAEIAAGKKVITDSAGLAMLRLEIAAKNEYTEAIGGVVPEAVKAEQAFLALGERMKTLDVKHHNEDQLDLNEALEAAGTSVEKLGGAQKAHELVLKFRRELLLNEADAQRESNDAARQAIELGHERGTKGVIDQKEYEIKLLRAQGADEEVITQKKIDQLEIERELALRKEHAGKLSAEESKRLSQEITLLREASRHRGRSGGRGRGRGAKEDPAVQAARERAELFAREITMIERLIEVEEARGKGADQLTEGMIRMQIAEAKAIEDIDARRTAEHALVMFQFEQAERVEALRDRVAERQIERDEYLAEKAEEARKRQEEAAARSEALLDARHKAELARQAKLDKARNESIDTYTRGLAESAFAAAEASDSNGKAFLKEAGEFAESRAKILGIESLMHFAKSVGWALAGNPIKASMSAAAGAKLGAEAAAMGGLAAGLGAAGDSALPGGGADFGGNAPSTSGQNARPESAGTAPVSPLEQNGGPVNQPTSGAGGGNSIVINVDGSFVDTGGQLSELINDASANGGMSLRGGMG
jgi:hypothetical protein